MLPVQRYKPQAKVTFHTEEGELVVRATNATSSDIDQDILSIITNRDMGADAPTFSMNLVNRRDWHRFIGANDLVEIEMVRPPESNARVFVGLVDDCRKRTVLSENSVERVITVTGRSLAKAFIRFDIGVVPEAEYASHIAGWIQDRGINVAGSTAKEIVKSIMDEIGKEFVNYKWSNGRSLFDLVRRDLTDKSNLILADDSNIVKWQGSMWALFKEVYEEPFYECFWEVHNNRETLVGRPTPFDKKDWDKLPVIEITDEDVVSDETGRSDIETYTLFSVGAKSLFAPHDTYKTLGVLPYWYEPFADKYGINRLHVETAYIAVADSTDLEESSDVDPTTSADIMRQLQEDIFNWNIHNNSMYNGGFTLKGSNKYKIGQRLRYRSVEDNSIMEYYITAVGQRFVNFGHWVTEVKVTRGMRARDRFSSPYGDAEEYKGMGLVPFDPEGSREAMQAEGSMGMGGQFGSGSANAVVEGARASMNRGNVRYVFGANDPAGGRLDCSSWTQWIYKEYAGIDIGRSTGQQVKQGEMLSRSLTQSTQLLRPGDLVFFRNTYNSSHIHGVSHVGIYVGDGNMIHNSSSQNVHQTHLPSSDYWKRHWLMSRRVLTESTGFNPTGNHGGGGGASIGAQMPSRFNTHVLGGKLSGTGSHFMLMGQRHGINYALMAAIAIHETGNGTSNAIRTRNNVGGFMRASGGLMNFSSVNKSIEYMADLLRRRYIGEGLTSIEAIQKRYAPINAANDPTGLNNHWVSGVQNYYNRLTR